jgi:hypothetical protein
MKLLQFFNNPTYKFKGLLNQFNKSKITSHIVALPILKMFFAVVENKPYGFLIAVLFVIIFTNKDNKG